MEFIIFGVGVGLFLMIVHCETERVKDGRHLDTKIQNLSNQIHKLEIDMRNKK